MLSDIKGRCFCYRQHCPCRFTSHSNYTPAVSTVLTVDSTPTYVMLGLSHITHLLTLFTDYLSLKLAYEIIPPSRGISSPCVRRSSTTNPLPLTTPPDPSHPSSPNKAWQGKKFKDLP